MKKAISIFLLGIFVFNTMGYFIAFKAIQYQIKSDIKSQIESGLNIPELSQIIIQNKDLKNVEFEGDDELKFQDDYYDIVTKSETALATTFYCIKDSEESQLFSCLDMHLDNQISNKPIKNDSGKQLVNNVIKVFFSSETLGLDVNPSTEVKIFSAYRLSNYSVQTSVSTPPPPEFV